MFSVDFLREVSISTWTSSPSPARRGRWVGGLVEQHGPGWVSFAVFLLFLKDLPKKPHLMGGAGIGFGVETGMFWGQLE